MWGRVRDIDNRRYSNKMRAFGLSLTIHTLEEELRRLLLSLMAIGLLVTSAIAEVNGVVNVVEGKKILWVWGTHQERGYAHGYLLPTEVKAMFEDYIVGHVCYGQASAYNSLRSFYTAHYVVDAPYADEAQAMVDGVVAAGVSPHCADLNRNIDATDLLVANAIVDLSQSVAGLASTGLGCSSLSSWATSTQSDSALLGSLLITRLMDWENYSTLAQNHLMIVSLPSEPDEQPWISFTFPALIGGLSAVAESGVAAFLNVGNRSDYSFGDPFQAILFSVRSGIEKRDYDGDGTHTQSDVLAAIEGRNRSSGTIIHVVKDAGAASHPIIIECNNENGVATRDVTFEDDITGENLAATNHFRALYPPVYCNRYNAISDSMEASADLSVDRSWNVMIHAGAQSNNLHVIEYAPSLSLLRWATSTVGHPAYQNDPAVFDVGALFQPPATADPGAPSSIRLVSASPNPFSGQTSVRFSLSSSGQCKLAAYGLDGSLVTLLHDGWMDAGPHSVVWQGVPGSGVYVLRLDTTAGTNSTKVVRVQ